MVQGKKGGINKKRFGIIEKELKKKLFEEPKNLRILGLRASSVIISHMKFLPILPELAVTNFKKSLHFYVDIIGFKVEYQRKNPNFAFLSYQGSQLMIQELEPGEKESEKLEYPFGRGINFQINTDSVTKIIELLNKHNYPITRGIKDSWYKGGSALYGCREILVNDPDAYLLRFSEEIGQKPA